jgi:hypothetical protein
MVAMTSGGAFRPVPPRTGSMLSRVMFNQIAHGGPLIRRPWQRAWRRHR